ncbi:hypothetical protein FA15DRAFT_711237 [Coprinopsis marcescibilis]|uniref:Uncharacterized protein n=1 Tax=Coprinopsis marcescibilis TaxID=230819 RepID=A0A5C3KB50_COPMA|nr:hypothetical protein FA15DRAFT_711237 [Coprinopsis marcescibilis]
MHERTGATGFFVVARGHVNDSFVPAIADAGDASTFFVEVLGMTGNELARNFDAWCVARSDDYKAKGPTLQVMQKECIAMISEGLNLLAGHRNCSIGMEYERFQLNIELRYRITLRGWPEGVPFKSLSKLSTVSEVTMLCTALRNGTCVWAALTNQEHEALSAAPAKPKKTRKRRSDAGVKRGSQKAKEREQELVNSGSDRSDGEVEHSHPCKKAWASKKSVEGQFPPQSRMNRSLDNAEEDSGSDSAGETGNVV